MIRIVSLPLKVVTCAILVLPLSRAHADCGSIPFYAPILQPIDLVSTNDPGSNSTTRVDFDPLKVSVFEPKQRAIILWNGYEEVLLLSTDQRATQRSAVLEVIPLPSEPKVRLGSFKTFSLAQKLVVEKRMWACAHPGAPADLLKLPADAGRITFAEKMGAHDLAVAQVTSPSGFVDFVQGYLRDHYQTKEAPIRPEFVKIIQSYLDEGYRWFAFDVIQMDGTLQSREPIEYRFFSDRVHYPLRISSLEKGETDAELLVITGDGAKHFEGIAERAIERQPVLGITTKEVSDLDASWAGFFHGRASVSLDQWNIKGPSSTLVRDVAVK
ncbi:MAG: DUF2330 domain-containing protein [Candidatus Sumerlaeaceae bacterium]|nr:DUF2330 domain-containing protein [Candidatus Sumerlaeaceae bacterium]